MDTIDEVKEGIEKEVKEESNETFSWCGYDWKSSMDGGRLIHPDYSWYWYSSGPIKVCSDDILELGIEKNPKEIKHWNGKTYNPMYEVATMRSVNSFSYGTYSAEIMMPTGMNLWPSFWLTGDGNWPPEIDIMEGWSNNNRYFKWFIAQPPYFLPSWRTTTNVHYRDDKMEHKSVGTRNIPWIRQKKSPTDNFIEYKCVWQPNLIAFFVDGLVFRVIDDPEICKALVTNVADPEKARKMNVIFNVWCEDPSKKDIKMYAPMKIKNFKFEPYTVYFVPTKQ